MGGADHTRVLCVFYVCVRVYVYLYSGEAETHKHVGIHCPVSMSVFGVQTKQDHTGSLARVRGSAVIIDPTADVKPQRLFNCCLP